MTTPNDVAASLTIGNDGDFSAQFSNLSTQQDSESENDEIAELRQTKPGTDDMDDEIDLGTFKPKLNDKFLSMPRDGGFAAQFQTRQVENDHNVPVKNVRPGNRIVDHTKFVSLGRDGGLNSELPKLQSSFTRTTASATGATGGRRTSFKVQLQNMDELSEIEDLTDDESTVTSMDLKLRRSSVGKNMAALFGLNELEALIDEDEISNNIINKSDNADPVFQSKFKPDEMRCLALVAHNHMKPAIKSFVLANKNLLCKFKLTGTNTTMTMLREVFGNDPSVKYGPTCTSGPLGGDAELVSIMCTENLGGCVFFQDPMSSHPHAADIECLARQANVHNILMMANPATAQLCMVSMRIALQEGKAELIPSFFRTLQSPSVAEYKVRQALVVEKNRINK